MYSSTRWFESHTVFEDRCNEGEHVAFLICFDEREFQRILHLPRLIETDLLSVSSCSIRTAPPFQSRFGIVFSSLDKNEVGVGGAPVVRGPLQTGFANYTVFF